MCPPVDLDFQLFIAPDADENLSMLAGEALSVFIGRTRREEALNAEDEESEYPEFYSDGEFWEPEE